MPDKRKFKDVRLIRSQEAYLRIYDDEVAGYIDDTAYVMVTPDCWETYLTDCEVVNEGEE